MRARSSAPGRAATMKNTPTARWAGSHPTNTRANGHNTTNNNQQPSKHPAHKTRSEQVDAQPDLVPPLVHLVAGSVHAPTEAAEW